MAESCQPTPLPLYTPAYPICVPSRTPGPLGINDQGDPSTISYAGNTCGPIGYNDHADPTAALTCELPRNAPSSPATPLDDPDSDGLTVALSPLQLAAVLEGQSINEDETRSNRLWGAVGLFGCGLELVGAAGLLLTPEPTGATKVGGIVLGLHALDSCQTAAHQVYSGREQRTLTQQGVAAAARALGARESASEKAGMVVDILVPIVVAAGVGAARAIAVRSGRIGLLAEEAAGGHTIARHVGKTLGELRQRLTDFPKLTAVSTFRDLHLAEAVISDGMRANAQQIKAWAAGAKTGATKAFFHDAGKVVGDVLARNSPALKETAKLRIVLRKINSKDRIYFILTAFPEL